MPMPAAIGSAKPRSPQTRMSLTRLLALLGTGGLVVDRQPRLVLVSGSGLPYPDPFTPPEMASSFWYWCDAYQQYYPYVGACPSGWRAVPPQSP
jgi:hypothetical protein